MFVSSTTIIFRLLNGAALVFVGWYLFKRYAYGTIVGIMQSRRDDIDALAQERIALQARQQRIEKEVHDQELFYQTMLYNVEQWNRKIEEGSGAREQRRLAIAVAQEKRRTVQCRQRALESALHHEVPKVLAKVRTELTTIFERDQVGHEYLKKLLLGIGNDKHVH